MRLRDSGCNSSSDKILPSPACTQSSEFSALITVPGLTEEVVVATAASGGEFTAVATEEVAVAAAAPGIEVLEAVAFGAKVLEAEELKFAGVISDDEALADEITFTL